MKKGEIPPNFNYELITGSEFDLYSTLKSGPVVLNFIMGTWWSSCANHLKKFVTGKKP